MSAGNIITLAICAAVAGAYLWISRRAWVGLWIGLRGIPRGFAAIVKGDLDESLKGLEDAIRYMNGEGKS